MEEIVEAKRDLYYSDVKEKIIPIFIKPVLEKKYTILKDESNKNEYNLYGTDTSNFVRDFIRELGEIYENKEEGEAFKIYAKRVNLNTIIIRFNKCPLFVRIINIMNDVHFINDIIPSIYLLLHRSFHTLCFPEIYNFIDDAENMIYNNEKLINKAISNINIERNRKKEKRKKRVYVSSDIENILYPYSDDYIRIGSLALKKIYGITSDVIRYPEIICVDGFTLLYKTFKSNSEYKAYILRSDFEFFNVSFIVYLGKKIVLRVYNGKNFCYPYKYISGKKYGTYSLLMKYYILHIMDGRIKGKKKSIIKDIYFEQKKIGGIIPSINPECLGNNVSSYRMYYLKNWGKKPWSYQRTIYI